jgi:hypothetical protein
MNINRKQGGGLWPSRSKLLKQRERREEDDKLSSSSRLSSNVLCVPLVITLSALASDAV